MLDASKYGPWALIAGGSDGLGAAFADQLAAAGLNLVLVARREAVLAETAAAIRAAHGVEVRIVSADITADDLIDRLRAATDDIEIGLLICNAGGADSPKPFLDRPVHYSLNLITFNVMAQMRLAHHFGAAMAARGRGGVILMSSGASMVGMADMAGYSAAKAATNVFGEALWAEWEPLGVDVVTCVIGRTDTPSMRRTELQPAATPPDNPADIAAFALSSLGSGPVAMPPHLAPQMEALRTMPRAAAATRMRAAIRGS
jgi:short-subunit dehydrogenase